MRYPIFIPSKGRPAETLTTKVLDEEQIDYFIVVEPSEFLAYKMNFKNVLVLPKNNQGIAYARRACKRMATEMGFKYHWQLDDNIKSFRRRPKNNKAPAKPMLKEVENYVDNHQNIHIASLRYSAFAFGMKNDIDFNKNMASAMLIKCNIEADFVDDIIEDTDMTLQVLYTGNCTVIFNRITIEKVTPGTMKGGNKSIEYGEKSLIRNSNLADKYYPYFKVKFDKKRGIYKLAPSRIWRIFKQRPLLLGQVETKENTLF